jgi:cyanate lyase
MFADLLQTTFGSVPHGQPFHIEQKGREARQGDIHMTWMKHKLMWEIKNYEYTVPTKEVQKFVRDMEEAKDIGLGVMVSLHTNISGHTKAGGIDIIELSDGRFCVYISKLFSTEDPAAFLQSIKPFLEVLLEQREADETKSAKSDGDDAAKRLLERFEEHRQIVVRLLKDHEEKTKAFRNVIMNAKRKSEGIWTEIMAEIAKAESSVALVLTTLLAAPKMEDDETTAEQEELTLPSFVFRNTSMIFYNPTQAKFIRDVLARFTIEADGKTTITKKELKEGLKDAGYTDDATSKLYEQVLLEDVWDKGKQKVRYFKRIP